MNSSTYTKPSSLKASIKPALMFVVLLWMIKIAETQFNFSLHFLGVYPLTIEGIVGIITGPLIHGSFEHLAGNSLALLILICGLNFGYPNSAAKTTLIIWLGSGLGTWLFAREAWHFGASGLTHGLFFFLFLASILRKDKRSIALMMIAFFMYGGMIMSIFPREASISFEYHLFGAIFGVLAAVLFRHSDPKMEDKTYDWENENSTETDLIGDEWRPDNDAQPDISSSSLQESSHQRSPLVISENSHNDQSPHNNLVANGNHLAADNNNKRPSDG